MKKQILSLVVTLGIVAALSVAAMADLIPLVRADIPFSFMVGKKQLPAGRYTVERIANNALIIRGLENKKAVMSIVYGGKTRSEVPEARLVFHRYGDRYFLAEIWDGQSDTAKKFPRTPAERETADQWRKHLARADAEPEIVSVKALSGE